MDDEVDVSPPLVRSDTTAAGDWTCPDCANVNFARRTSCNRCHKTRTPLPPTPPPSTGSAAAAAAKKRKLGHEIGKAAAEKSRGLFSADDWQCNKCGNVNWARRQQCNVCNAPKFGEVEERTGFGGGYNDRGVVEYKEREESDDEYDEFGRKKKKRYERFNEKPKEKKTVVINTKQENEEDEEEDDDDDEDDDGDLSKYDLSDWGDVTSNNKTHNNSRSKSRSRSRSPIRKIE